MIAWMAYAALTGGVVAVAGLALERLAEAAGRPRRIAWLAALALSVAIPLTGGWRGVGAMPGAADRARPAAQATVAVGDRRGAMRALPVREGAGFDRIAALVWVSGSLGALAAVAGVLALVARGRRRWERRRVDGADVHVSRRFGPAVVGVARPVLVVPAWVLGREPGARRAIVRHEQEHARAHDHLALLWAGLVAAAFPWSPAIWWMYRRLRAAVELDCDERVLASGVGVADYGGVLLDAGSRSRGRWGLAPAMGQPRSLLERRLRAMSEKRRKLNVAGATVLAGVAAGALAVACDAPVPTELRDAIEEVMADRGRLDADAEREAARVEGRSFLGFLRSEGARLLYVDGVRIRADRPEDVPERVRSLFADPMGDHRIERIEVLKGEEATTLYGAEAVGGVIQVFTKELQRDAAAVAKAREQGAARRAALVEALRMREEANGGAPLQAPFPGRIVYIDDVRVDPGGRGLSELLPGAIDRIEVIGGSRARELYGEEGGEGVIRVFTKDGGGRASP